MGEQISTLECRCLFRFDAEVDRHQSSGSFRRE